MLMHIISKEVLTMLVGNVCYVTTCYNEDKFQILLENHLKTQRKGSKMNDELLEQCAAAYLECEKNHSNSPELEKMKNFLYQLDINISDCREYSSLKTTGDAHDAIKVFNTISKDYLIYRQEQ